WKADVNKLGFGVRLGVDVPAEGRGLVPSAKYYDKIYRPGGWRSTTVASLAIGQGELLATPLQLANIEATIANRGYYIRPHLVKAVGERKLIRKKYTEKHYVDIDARHFGPVIDGMEDAVNKSWGTAIESRIPGILMAGKTGTVQNSRGKNHSVFIGFAPRDNPKIAIAVIVENAGYGGQYAAPIASYLTELYLKDSVSISRRAAMDWIKYKNLLPELKAKVPVKPKPTDTPKKVTKQPVTLQTAGKRPNSVPRS
ncbi:MAG: penicillin-binding protein 2, partial [Sphingobacteriales bacterium]